MLAPSMIRWPRGQYLIEVENGFRKRGPFSKILGAIDGTYFKIPQPSDDPHSYFNRCHYSSVTMQAVCDHNMMFTDVFIGIPSAANDYTIFQCSELYQGIQTRKSDFFLSKYLCN